MTKQEYRSKLKEIAGLCYSLSIDLGESLDREEVLEQYIWTLQKALKSRGCTKSYVYKDPKMISVDSATRRSYKVFRNADFKED